MPVAANELHNDYLYAGMSDNEIARKYGMYRTTVLRMRQRNGIETREYTGKLGESVAISELRKRGFHVIDMNQTSRTHHFDLLINNRLRIDVKTSSLSKRYNRFEFVLSEKPQNGNIESDIRIRLKNGRLRKLYHKTCDFLMLIGLVESENKIFLIPSDSISHSIQRITIPSDLSNSKYAVFKDRWDILLARLEGVLM